MASNPVKEALERMREAGRKSVYVGLVGPTATALHPDGNGLTVAEVGALNYYGHGHVPARPFLDVGLQRGADKMAAVQEAAARAVAEGRRTVDQALNAVGLVAQGVIQEAIADGAVPPPNAPSTIKAKKSSKPLVDSGVLRQSITFVVR